MLRPNLLGSYEEFGSKYCLQAGQEASVGGAGGSNGLPHWQQQRQFQGCNLTRSEELHQLLMANVMVRRTKTQVSLDLPEKARIKVRPQGLYKGCTRAVQGLYKGCTRATGTRVALETHSLFCCCCRGLPCRSDQHLVGPACCSWLA
jgi:hypothetical protein